MSNPIITIDRLSKAYRLGAKDQTPDTLVGAAKSLLTAPLRNFRELSKLNTFSAKDADEDDQTLWALRDISFDVEEGEVVGVIGRNGAGKSTLLKVLSRITDPTSGRAVIRGRVSSLLEVGTGFHPELSGRENVYMNGTILGMTKREIDRKFDEIVDFSGVERFLDTPIKRYSSGMQVRLAFAVAAHLEPEILIIDEVLAVGDAEFQSKCLGKMRDVAESGRTVLFVSHNLQATESLCSRAVLLSRGTVDFLGPTDEAIAVYMKKRDSSPLDPMLGSCILSLDILDSSHKPTVTVAHLDAFQLCIRFRLAHAIDRPSIGISIDDPSSRFRVFGSASHIQEQLPTLPAGTYTAHIAFEAPTLAPRTYALTAAIASANNTLHAAEDITELTILPTLSFPSSSIGRNLGVCTMPHRWSLQYTDQNA